MNYRESTDKETELRTKEINNVCRLIKVLGSDRNEIVGPFDIDGSNISTFEWADENNFYVNIWVDGLEFQTPSEDIETKSITKIRKYLEQLL
jgi:hypothetical protein